MEYSTQKQSQELATKLWSIANELKRKYGCFKIQKLYFRSYFL